MTRKYTLNHRLVACVLLISLFLQSCGNSFISPVSTNGRHQHEKDPIREQPLGIVLYEREPIVDDFDNDQTAREFAIMGDSAAREWLEQKAGLGDASAADLLKTINEGEEKKKKEEVAEKAEKEPEINQAVRKEITPLKIKGPDAKIIDLSKLSKEELNKLERDICNYRYHPNDYVHGLLASHVYNDPKVGEEVDLKAVAQKLGHELPTTINTNWKVVNSEDRIQESGFYSALYINEDTHQAVLAFQGTYLDSQDIMRTAKDLAADINEVLGNAIGEQTLLAYEATQDAVEYANKKGFHLSITGHSLGGYLAELGVAFCRRYFNNIHVKAIVFDSPGTDRTLKKLESNVINQSTEFKIGNLPITAYLSVPNFVNACNRHPGEVYRLYPSNLKWDDYIEGWIKRAISLPLVGEDIEDTIKPLNKGLVTITGHSLDMMLALFDPIKGKPIMYKRIADWPKLNTDHILYIGKGDTIITDAGSWFGNKLGGKWGSFLGARLGTDMAKYLNTTFITLASAFADVFNVDQRQYWTALAHLDDNYREVTLEPKEEFKHKYEGHYELDNKRDLHEHVLYVDKFRSADWCLYELDKYRFKLDKLSDKDIRIRILKNILNDYTIKPIDEKVHIRLNSSEAYIDPLRDKMRRASDVLLPDCNIESVLDDPTLTKQCEKDRLQQLMDIKQPKLENYIPRESKQQELTQILEEKGVCVVYGYGGVGKTTLVSQYGHGRKGEQLVWEIKADTEEELIKNYQDIAENLGIYYQTLAEQFRDNPKKYHQQLAGKVYNALSDCKQSALLILDNAVDPALIADFLALRPHLVQVIITTRDQKSYKNYNYSQLKLDTFTMEEGKKYIEKRLKELDPSKEDIEALIKEEGRNPKKLELVTAYIRDSIFMDIQKYINEIRKAKKGLGIEDSDKLSLLTQIRSILGLKEINSKAQLLMRYGTYLDVDFIPYQLIVDLLKVKGAGQKELNEIFVPLERLSLITIVNTRTQKGIQIHREVQAACKEYKDWKGKDELLDQDLVKNLMEVLNQTMPKVERFSDRTTCEQVKLYAPQIAYLLATINKETAAHPLLADLLDQMGDYNMVVQFNYHQALNYYQQALEMRQALYKGNHSDIAASLSSLGIYYKDLDKHEEALAYYEQAFEMYQALYKGNHPYIASSLNNLGMIYQKLGKYEVALKYAKQALEMKQVLYKGNHPDVTVVLNNLASVYKSLGKHKESLEYFNQAFEMCQALYTGNHPYIASSLNNLGMIYQGSGKSEEALKYLKKALEMYQALYTGNHPYIANSLDNIGIIYRYLGQYEEALKYHRQALEMNQALYTDNHSYIATSLDNLGLAYRALGNYQEALEHVKKALEMNQALYLGNHPYIAMSLNNIGIVYFDLGQNKEALKYLEQALEMRKALYPSGNHLDIANSLNNIGMTYKNLHNYQESLKYLKQALEMWQALYSDNHSDIANSLNNIGVFYADLGQNKEALKYLEQALEMRKALYPSGNHPEVVTSLKNIGAVYNRLEEHQKTLKYYEEALGMEKAIYPDNHPSIAASLGNIGHVYYSLGEHQKALKYLEEALVMQQAIYPGNHPNIANSLYNIGAAYSDLGQYQEALNYLQQALEMMQTMYKGNHSDIASSLNSIGVAYYGLGQYQEALKHLEEALEMRRTLYSGNHPGIAVTLRNLGIVYYDLGKYQEALKYYEQSLEMEKALDKGKHTNSNSVSVTKLGSLEFGQAGIDIRKELGDQASSLTMQAKYMSERTDNHWITMCTYVDTGEKCIVHDEKLNGTWWNKNELTSICMIDELDSDEGTKLSSSVEPARNSANRDTSFWSTAVHWIKGLAGWTKEEKEVDIDNIHIKGLLTLKTKCQDMIEKDAQVKKDKWYQYSLEDMIEDIDEVLIDVSSINEATLACFKKRLLGINKDFLRPNVVQRSVATPYKIKPVGNQLQEVQLLVSGVSMLGYQGGNMLALPK